MNITIGALLSMILGSNGLFVFVQYLITRHDKQKDTKDEQIASIKADVEQMKATEAIVMYSVFSNKLERLLDKGYADPDDRRDVENMFERYKANGWNGDMDARVAKVYALPTKRIEKGKYDD